MGKINLLDCTLRDGGYINDWNFGKNAIEQILRKLSLTGIEMIEVGFLKGFSYQPDQSLFPNVESIKTVLTQKNQNVLYVAMLDMSEPIPISGITYNDGTSIDGIRIIFKKDKINEAYTYCQHIQKMGYSLFVNFVNTDTYSDKEFIEVIEKYNVLHPYGMTIVDTFGMLKRKHFLRLAAIADNNMDKNIMLCYHAHNNLQQAFSNAEALLDMNLSRDICIDACVFGMGRGAGNLNLELFTEFMNEKYGTNYNIAPMLEIMDEYLSDIYRTRFWGYSLPLYLSATMGCHPNYAIYLAEKNTLPVKAFGELLQSISPEDKQVFSKEKADYYYRDFLDSFIDDKESIDRLEKEIGEKEVILIGPGKTIHDYQDIILKECLRDNVIITINFYSNVFEPDYIFVSNMKRIQRTHDKSSAKMIVTSNIKDIKEADYTINYSSYLGKNGKIVDNAGLMALRLLIRIGIKHVKIVGMDGYDNGYDTNYFDSEFEIGNQQNMTDLNDLMTQELGIIGQMIKLEFITPTKYKMENIV